MVSGMKKFFLIGLLFFALVLLVYHFAGRNGEMYSEHFAPVVQELEDSWDDGVTISIIDKWWDKGLNVNGYYKEDKTFECYVDNSHLVFNLENELADSDEWHWELAGTFENKQDGSVYLCLYDMNFLYEEGVVQNPQLLLIRFRKNNPEDYHIESYVVEPSYAVCWVNSCYHIDNDIYIAGENELFAINMETMQLRDCKREYLAMKEYAEKSIDEKELHIYHFRAIYQDEDIRVYSAQVSEASDIEPTKTIYVAYKEDKAIAFMSINLETHEIIGEL